MFTALDARYAFKKKTEKEKKRIYIMNLAVAFEWFNVRPNEHE